MTFLLKDPSNNLAFSATKDGDSNALQLTAGVLAIGNWKHVAVVLSGGMGTLYVDGAPVSGPTTILRPADLGDIDYAFIGRSQFSNDPYLDARIDEFRVYRRALSPQEIAELVAYTGPS
jgi:hypothetical protein